MMLYALTIFVVFFQLSSEVMVSQAELGVIGGLSIVLSPTIILVVSKFSKTIIWGVYILSGVLPTAVMILCWTEYYHQVTRQEDKLVLAHTTPEGLNWLAYSIVISIVWLVVVLLIFVMRNRLKLVAQLFHEAGRAIISVPLIIVLPLWTLFWCGVLLVLMVFGIMYLFTSGAAQVMKETGEVKFVYDATMNVSENKILQLYT